LSSIVTAFPENWRTGVPRVAFCKEQEVSFRAPEFSEGDDAILRLYEGLATLIWTWPHNCTYTSKLMPRWQYEYRIGLELEVFKEGNVRKSIKETGRQKRDNSNKKQSFLKQR
jgi:hypothetical protein